MGKLLGNDESRNYLSSVVLRASWAYISRGYYNHHHSSSRILFGSNSNCSVSQGNIIHSCRRDLIFEPLAGSCYHESGF